MTLANDLMTAFTARTAGPGQRYLWTDAFAVCNLLAEGRADLARELIDRVHHELGRHRSDDPRRGWISGLPDSEGEDHPAIGGLRIGKPQPERTADERYDEQREWDRDGQYFHYLTKWMHALDQVGRYGAHPELSRWARELADTAYRRFVYAADGTRAMYWKMSIDLSRPQVASMGHHDPVDGYVTLLQLRATATSGPDLAPAIAEFREMIEPGAIATSDPLGIGGLLFDAYRLSQLDVDRPLRASIVAAARLGLALYLEQHPLAVPVERRLAFRELGLAIGLEAAEPLELPDLARLRRLRDSIVGFWSDPTNRSGPVYLEHRDINDVMLATSLEPTGFLALRR